VNDQHGRYARIRYTATGAVAALAAAGAIAGAVALAAPPPAKTPGRAAVANCPATKRPVAPGADKIGAPGPAPNPQPFLNAVQQLVNSGTITATEGQALDHEIVAGRVDTDTLASSGFTPTQLQAVQNALGNAKRALAASMSRTSK
jgi:hypothetical protein